MLDSQIRITPMARLTAARLEDLILRREDPCQPVCYSCNQSAMMLIPFNGLLRCENCDSLRAHGDSPVKIKTHTYRKPNSPRVVAVVDPLAGVSVHVFGSPKEIGKCYAITECQPKRKHDEFAAMLHARIVRKVSIEEVRAMLPDKRRSLANGYWYEILAD